METNDDGQDDFIIKCDQCGDVLDLRELNDFETDFQICCECARFYCADCVSQYMTQTCYSVRYSHDGWRYIPTELMEGFWYCERCYVELDEEMRNPINLN